MITSNLCNSISSPQTIAHLSNYNPDMITYDESALNKYFQHRLLNNCDETTLMVIANIINNEKTILPIFDNPILMRNMRVNYKSYLKYAKDIQTNDEPVIMAEYAFIEPYNIFTDRIVEFVTGHNGHNRSHFKHVHMDGISGLTISRNCKYVTGTIGTDTVFEAAQNIEEMHIIDAHICSPGNMSSEWTIDISQFTGLRSLSLHISSQESDINICSDKLVSLSIYNATPGTINVSAPNLRMINIAEF